MSSDWARLCRGKDFSVEGDRIEVALHDARRHVVSVQDVIDGYRLTARVVGPSFVNASLDAALIAWRRNRTSKLVGFRIDTRGRLMGEALVPKAGLIAQEFQLYVRTVAVEADRFEFVLTGRDRE